MPVAALVSSSVSLIRDTDLGLHNIPYRTQYMAMGTPLSGLLHAPRLEVTSSRPAFDSIATKPRDRLPIFSIIQVR